MGKKLGILHNNIMQDAHLLAISFASTFACFALRMSCTPKCSQRQSKQAAQRNPSLARQRPKFDWQSTFCKPQQQQQPV